MRRSGPTRSASGRGPAPPARGPVLALAATLAVLASTPPAGAGEASPFVGFAPRAGFAGLGEARAVAAAPDGRVAAGDAGGVWLAAPGRVARRVLRRGPVRDLRFEADGTLLAATDRGLFAVGARGEVRDLGPGPGAAARQVRRVASADGLRLAATAGGVFAGPAGEGGAMRRLDARLPSGDTAALALTPAAGGAPGDAPWLLHVVMDGELWRARLVDGPRGWRAADAVRRVLEGVPGTPRDVVAHPGYGIVLLTDRALAVGPPEGALRPHRLELPPGATPRRLVRTAGRLWLATDGGLLRLDADGARARARRVAPPAGRVATHDVAAGPGGLLAATARGLLAAPPPAAAAAAATSPDAEASSDLFAGEPPVQAVHRAALAWLDLGPGPVRSLRRRAGRRGWLPTLELRGGYEGGRSLARDEDETYTGGALRRFHDVDRDRDRGFDVAAVLRWDLGDAVFHPEEIDASREAREVIELRDEVLDEINQLYHERRRVLLDASQRPADDAEAARLRLRAAELGAGLDAWTGGWWSRQLPSSPARSPEPRTP